MINNGQGIVETDYSNAILTKPGKKFLVYLLDYLLVMVIAILFFGLIDLTGNAFPSYQAIKNETSTSQSDLYKIVYSSHLSSQTSTSDFMDETQIVNDYMYGLALASASDSSYKEMSAFSGKEEVNADNDRIFYYYNTYRQDNKDQYESQFDTSSYLIKIYPNSNTYFTSNNGFYLLTQNSAELMINYILYSTNTQGKTIYQAIESDYKSSYEAAMKDLQTSSAYKQASDKFEAGKDRILLLRTSYLLIGYILSCSICYIMLPLIFKNGQTIGMKAFGMIATSIEGNKPKVLSLLSKWLMLLIELFSINLFSVFILFGAEGRYLLGVNVWGFINILYVSIFSLAIMFASLIVMIAKRKDHQTLSEIISMQLMRNSKEFKLEEKKEEKEEETHE